MAINSFEELIAWQKSRGLTSLVYKTFRDVRDHGFRDQIQRASVSVGNNIAEGFERKGSKEFSRFLFISKGSAGEVRSMLYHALDLGYISKIQFDEISILTTEVSRLVSGLIKSLR